MGSRLEAIEEAFRAYDERDNSNYYGRLIHLQKTLFGEGRALLEVARAAQAFATKQVSVDVTEIIEQVVADVHNGLEPDMDNAVRWTAYTLQESDEAFALNAALAPLLAEDQP